MKEVSQMFNFSKLPFFDNHTHNIRVTNHTLDPIELVLAFIHGYADIPNEQGRRMEGSIGKQY